MPDHQPGRVIAILGMHRSGTSCLTGSLQAAGLTLGKFHTFNKYNRKGNRENQDVINLHEALLKDNDGAWDKPPATNHWSDKRLQRARDILKEYENEALWGFKDPRTLLFMEGWLELVPTIQFVGIYRHPMAVAQSLHARKALPISLDEAIALWKHYNEKLWVLYQRQPFPLLCFDWPEDKMNDRLNIVNEKLGIKSMEDTEKFYSSELHKQLYVEEDFGLPKDIIDLYQKFQDHSL